MNNASDYLAYDGRGFTAYDITEPLWPPERRKAILRRMLPGELPELIRTIEDGWPSMYPSAFARERGVVRDLHALGAEKIDGLWCLPRTK